MRWLLFGLLSLGSENFYAAQTAISPNPSIGVVEVYGIRRIPEAEVRKVTGVAPGARLPASKATVEDRLQALPGVEGASLEAACCDAGKVILYIGIRETGSPGIRFREDPGDSPDLPDPVQLAYGKFLDQVREAGKSGQASEDLSAGHSLLSNPQAREAQLAFIPLATEHTAQLREVLRNSSDSDHRAIAAYVLGYARDKKSVVEDLAFALSDADATVRGNAARAIAAIAVYAEQNKESGVAVNPGWFVDLLNSEVWTDRNNAAIALVNLTESRKVEILDQLRERSLVSLTEMARWRHPPHALPAFILLGRIAGIEESDLQAAWTKGERERIIGRAISLEKQ